MRKNGGKSAWLVTVSNMGIGHWGGEHGKVVAVLPPLLSMARVKEIVCALWYAQPQFDASDRVFYGLSKKEQDKQFTKMDSDAFSFGFKPFFHARRVTNLQCGVSDGVCTVRWRETPRFGKNSETGATVLERGPVEGVWAEPVAGDE